MNLQQLLNLVVDPYMPEALISKANMARIGQVAQHFPNQLTSFFGFECRLGENEAAGDFLFCTTQANAERQILAGHHTDEKIPADLLGLDVWKRVRRFAELWNDPDSILYHQADKLWFEFDMEDIQLEAPIPSFFFGPQNINTQSDLKQVCQTALGPLLNGGLAEGIWQNLTNCIDRLPQGARIFQVGTMLSRDTPAIRLCINKMRPDQIPYFLKELNWSGSEEQLNQFLLHLGILVDHVSLNIDVGTSVLPKIGLECYIDQNEMATTKWLRLLNTLEDTGLCVAEKKEAMKVYAGGVHRFMTNKVWPEHLLATSRSLRNSQLSLYARNINHVKVAFGPEQEPVAKAYLSVKHMWIPTQQIVEKQRELTTSTSTSEY